MLNADPRFLIAETYRLIKKDLGLLAEFDKKLNHDVKSPQEAITLCLEYQELANA